MPVMCSTVGLPIEKGMDEGAASPESAAIFTRYACDMTAFVVNARHAQLLQ